MPRHREIVSRILEDDHATVLTSLIGFFEIAMAFWILSGIKTRTNAITQMIIIAVMNTLEFILASDLLLWGRFNAFFASLFILLIFYNEFQLNNDTSQQA